MKEAANPNAIRILRILLERDGIATHVQLNKGQLCIVYNIVWGQDIGDPDYHITTNIEPEPKDPHSIDFFFTHEVVTITAPESMMVLFTRNSEQ